MIGTLGAPAPILGRTVNAYGKAGLGAGDDRTAWPATVTFFLTLHDREGRL
jgi:hypothetical protein